MASPTAPAAPPPPAPASPTASVAPSILPAPSSPVAGGAPGAFPSAAEGTVATTTPAASNAVATAPAAGAVAGATSTALTDPSLGGVSPYGGYGGYGMGMGMDPYGMGMGLGMGGLGMMGLGGMGMMGMGMMGMTPEAQRGQMMMFMVQRMVELWGMFSQVIQMTFGSALQFAGNYVGINQKLGQMDEEALAQEERYYLQNKAFHEAIKDLPKEEKHVEVEDSPLLRKRKQRAAARPSLARRVIVRLLRHVIIIAIAYFASKKIIQFFSKNEAADMIEAFTEETRQLKQPA